MSFSSFFCLDRVLTYGNSLGLEAVTDNTEASKPTVSSQGELSFPQNLLQLGEGVGRGE